MGRAFAIQMTDRGRRATLGVLCLLVVLPALFLVLREVLPNAKPAEDFVRVEVVMTDAKTGIRVGRALVRVYRKVNDRELPDMPPKETFDGIAMLRVRPKTAKSSLAYLGIDASGYLPFNGALVPLMEASETLGGEPRIEITLTPE